MEDLRRTRRQPINKFIVGYTTRDHLLLDIDGKSFDVVKRLAHEIVQSFPDVGDCLIMRCAVNSHHLIFNNKLSWGRILHIIKTLAALRILNRDYVRIREFRGDLTLRISEKETPNKKRLIPTVAGHILSRGLQPYDHMIYDYLAALHNYARSNLAQLLTHRQQPEPRQSPRPTTDILLQKQILSNIRRQLLGVKASSTGYELL